MTLRSFLIKRTIYTIILVFFVIVLNFLIFQAMPGATGVQYNILGQRTRLSPDYYKYITNLYDLNASYSDRFVAYVRNLLTFQFGISYQYNQPVVQQMIDSGRLVNTLTLLGASTVLAIIIGIALGIIASKRRGTGLDSFLVSASLTTFSLPTFFMGILLIFIFALSLGWFPAGAVMPGEWGQTSGAGSGYPSLLAQIPIRLQYLFLPTLTLTLFSYGGFLLLTRATMMETLSEDYVLTARAKGLSERVILFKHAFKNASLPIVTASALAFGGILSGAIITETVFNWAGLGRWLYDAVLYKDYPVMQAMFYLIALGVIAANFISDVIYGIIDPRIRYE